MSERVLLVSAGLLVPKKPGNPVAREYLYLNYGLLGLATRLSSHGYDPLVVHGRHESPVTLAERLNAEGLLKTLRPAFLSVPSSFALPWAQAFIAHAKNLEPDCLMVAGGRWPFNGDAQWARKMLPLADLIVFGTADDRIISLLNFQRWDEIPYTDRSPSPVSERPTLPPLDMRLVEDYQEYQPSIELSRGCGMGCAFCVEADVPMSMLKSPASTISEMQRLCEVYSTSDIHPYFEASLFRPTKRWTREFKQRYEESGLQVSWRCETRVDHLTEDVLDDLSRAGLKVIDVGLESASEAQLIAMGKTPNPSMYLQRASAFLRQCQERGIWVKVNVLLYAGESIETVKQTLKWIEEHRGCIKGVSVYPVIVYRTPHVARYVAELRKLGATLVDGSELDDKGYASLHLSPEIDYERSLTLSRQISRRFMLAGDYFDLKSFSYFPRSFSRDRFYDMCRNVDGSLLPFRIE